MTRIETLINKALDLSTQLQDADRGDPESGSGIELVQPISQLLLEIAAEKSLELDDPEMLWIGQNYFNLTPTGMTKMVPKLAYTRQETH